MRASLAAAAVVVFALTSLAAPVAAGAAAGHAVPFIGTLRGVETTTSFTPPSTVSILLEGTGIATHLGRFTLENPHVVDTSTMHGCGNYVFTAANGDTVSAAGCGDAFLTATPGVLFIVEHATISGGTGRFAAATGSFTVKRLFDGATGSTIGFFTGTIFSSRAGEH